MMYFAYLVLFLFNGFMTALWVDNEEYGWAVWGFLVTIWMLVMMVLTYGDLS